MNALKATDGYNGDKQNEQKKGAETSQKSLFRCLVTSQ